MNLVNLGCGRRFHPIWRNFDFVSTAPEVEQADLRTGIPLPDEYADAVYHSHVLEHFSREDAKSFLQECHRILKPGGVLRISVPDLEQITLAYLASLTALRQNPNPDRDRRHQWHIAEIVDQCARHSSTGSCGSMLKDWPVNDRPFLLARWGAEAERLFDANASRIKARARMSLIMRALKRIRIAIGCLLTGASEDVLEVGRFRLNGEPHLWMYDEMSLRAALESVGFTSIQRSTAFTSAIPQWPSFNLDTDDGNRTHKPDSLFMEAVK